VADFLGGWCAYAVDLIEKAELFESLVKLVSNTYGNSAMIQKLTLAINYLRLPTVSTRPIADVDAFALNGHVVRVALYSDS
jgi:hypothetical protein